MASPSGAKVAFDVKRVSCVPRCPFEVVRNDTTMTSGGKTNEAHLGTSLAGSSPQGQRLKEFIESQCILKMLERLVKSMNPVDIL